MTIFYLDFANGNDASDGSSWANAWKTITSGATAARIAPGDVIRIAKSPAPSSVGNGTWTGTSIVGGGFPATVSITSSTNASPIVITKNAHGFVNGDIVQVYGHTTNVTANGIWKVANKTANTLELEGSVGCGTGAATGTMQLVTSKIVQLASAQTKNICACEQIWTAGGTGDTTPTVDTGGKEGYGYCKLLLDASPQTNKLQAYFAIPSINFSSYQKISLWLFNSAAIADATTWKICLCSDNAGATPVDTFYIPAISTTASWNPLTITRNGGGNCGAAIQSIAVYTDATSPTASSYIYLDNIVACTSSGLNLQSLISKNSVEQGDTEGWYAIQSISINGTLIALDNGPQTIANAGRGYSGTTEIVATYIRETIKVAAGNGVLNDSGTAGNLIQYQGGYDTGTGNQTGETFIDGLCGVENGIYIFLKSYNLLNLINVCRYSIGICFSTCTYNTITTINNANNNVIGIYFIGVTVSNNTITTIGNINNNSGGIWFDNGSASNTIATINNANNNSVGVEMYTTITSSIATINNVNNNTNYGVQFQGGLNNIITTLNNANYNGYGIYVYPNVQNSTITTLSNANYNSIGIWISLNSTNFTIGTLTSASYNSSCGVRISSSNNITIGTLTNINYNLSYGVYFEYSNHCTITAISNVNTNLGGVYFVGSSYNMITTLANANNNTNYGVYFTNSSYNMITTLANANNNTNYGVYFTNSSYNTIRSASISSTTDVYSANSINYIRKALLAGTEFSLTASGSNKVYSWQHDQTANNDWVFMDGGTINKQSATTQSGSGYAWQFTVSSSTRTSMYPLSIKVAEIAVVANALVTITAYMKKDHATNVACKLRCQGGQLSGVPSDVEDIKADDTNWEQLTLTFTPTEAGIIVIEALAWYISGNSNCYIDSLTASQA